MIKDLDDAIQHCIEVAEKQKEKAKRIGELIHDEMYDYCFECASDHRQLAEWLRELKRYRNIIDTADERINNTYGVVIVEGYADVINDLKEVRDGGKR